MYKIFCYISVPIVKLFKTQHYVGILVFNTCTSMYWCHQYTILWASSLLTIHKFDVRYPPLLNVKMYLISWLGWKNGKITLSSLQKNPQYRRFIYMQKYINKKFIFLHIMICDHLKTKAGLQWGLPTKTTTGNQFILVSWSKPSNGQKAMSTVSNI